MSVIEVCVRACFVPLSIEPFGAVLGTVPRDAFDYHMATMCIAVFHGLETGRRALRPVVSVRHCAFVPFAIAQFGAPCSARRSCGL